MSDRAAAGSPAAVPSWGDDRQELANDKRTPLTSPPGRNRLPVGMKTPQRGSAAQRAPGARRAFERSGTPPVASARRSGRLRNDARLRQPFGIIALTATRMRHGPPARPRRTAWLGAAARQPPRHRFTI